MSCYRYLKRESLFVSFALLGFRPQKQHFSYMYIAAVPGRSPVSGVKYQCLSCCASIQQCMSIMEEIKLNHFCENKTKTDLPQIQDSNPQLSTRNALLSSTDKDNSATRRVIFQYQKQMCNLRSYNLTRYNKQDHSL